MFKRTEASATVANKRRAFLKMAAASVATATIPVSAAFAKGKVNYSPNMLALAEEAMASAQYKNALPRDVLNSKYRETIEIELAKFLALTQESRVAKLAAMGKCMVSQKLMTDSELSATLGLFRAMEAGDEGSAKEALAHFRETLKKSNGGSPFSRAMEEADANTAGFVGGALDFGAEIFEVATTAEGAAIGGLLGGPAGAVVGAVIGKVIGRAVTSTWKAIYRWASGSGKKEEEEEDEEDIASGPNGRDCTPPFNDFGRMPVGL